MMTTSGGLTQLWSLNGIENVEITGSAFDDILVGASAMMS